MELRRLLNTILPSCPPLSDYPDDLRDGAHDWPLEDLMSQPDFFKIRVAGTSFRQGAVRQVEEGDEVQFETDPENQHDNNAVKVLSGDRWLGFVPRDQAESLKVALEGGCKIKAKIAGKGKPEGSDSIGLLVELCVNYPES